jgi:hypothetical protein
MLRERRGSHWTWRSTCRTFWTRGSTATPSLCSSLCVTWVSTLRHSPPSSKNSAESCRPLLRPLRLLFPKTGSFVVVCLSLLFSMIVTRERICTQFESEMTRFLLVCVLWVSCNWLLKFLGEQANFYHQLLYNSIIPFISFFLLLFLFLF